MQRAAKHNRKNIYLKMSETCIWKMTDIWMWTRIAERERERERESQGLGRLQGQGQGEDSNTLQ